jgi:hypothetical protein
MPVTSAKTSVAERIKGIFWNIKPMAVTFYGSNSFIIFEHFLWCSSSPDMVWVRWFVEFQV